MEVHVVELYKWVNIDVCTVGHNITHVNSNTLRQILNLVFPDLEYHRNIFFEFCNLLGKLREYLFHPKISVFPQNCKR